MTYFIPLQELNADCRKACAKAVGHELILLNTPIDGRGVSRH